VQKSSSEIDGFVYLIHQYAGFMIAEITIADIIRYAKLRGHLLKELELMVNKTERKQDTHDAAIVSIALLSQVWLSITHYQACYAISSFRNVFFFSWIICA